MPKPLALILDWIPDGTMGRLEAAFPEFSFQDGRTSEVRDRFLAEATITYGLPPLERLDQARQLRWIQLISAGMPLEMCQPAREKEIVVTNLAGLYGPSIAEHALGMMLVLKRHLHLALRQQQEKKWEREIRQGMTDLHGGTLAIVGLGNIGQNIARLARAHGMRVVGCRRTPRPTPHVDCLYTRDELPAMLAEADILAVAAPLTHETRDMLGPAEFAALKSGAIYINVSRGPVARESALLDALGTGRIAAAGLDVFAVEPLPADHPFWTMPQVLVSPHYSGETINLSSLPIERFGRNLVSWKSGKELEGKVNLELGY